MTRYLLHIRSNDGQGRGYRSGTYHPAADTWADAVTAMRVFVADCVSDGWTVTKRRVDGSKTWLIMRNAHGELVRILVEIEEVTH